MLAIFAVILGVFNLGMVSSVKKPIDDVAMFKEVDARSVYVAVAKTESPDQIIGNGSGVIIKSTKDSSFVLTNHHVCLMINNPFIYVGQQPTGKVAVAEIVKFSAEKDICLLKTVGVIGTAAKLGTAKTPIIGEVTFSSDYSGLFYRLPGPQLNKGVVGERYIDGFRINHTEVYPGASGSGVFTANLELIGLQTRIIPHRKTTYMVDIVDILDFLADQKLE